MPPKPQWLVSTRLWAVRALTVGCVILYGVRAFSTFRNGILYIEEPEGATLSLPCDVTPPPGDSVAVILWYRDNLPSAAYTFDARNISGSIKQHTPRDPSLRSRASFDPSPPASLTLTHAMAQDSGDYECRVDFASAPSRTTRLRVVVVSRVEQLLAGAGRTWGGSQPLEEGVKTVAAPLHQQLTLHCCARGGNPRPKIWWQRGDKILDHSWSPEDDQMTCNEYTLFNVTRKDDLMSLTCHAENSNVTEGRTLKLVVEVLSPPSSVRLDGVPPALREGQRYPIDCLVAGGRPPPTVEWYLTRPKQTPTLLARQDLSEGAGGRGRLGVTVQRADEGATLSCKAFSDTFPDAPLLTDERIVAVHYAPVVQLSLGVTLQAGSIKEGSDLYFKCLVDATPNAHSVLWMRGSQVVRGGPGVLVSAEHLVLQNVSRHWSGKFTCSAVNSVGTTSSNAIRIIVKYPPVCLPRQRLVYWVSLDDVAKVRCGVRALPRQDVTFSWAFSNDVTEEEPLPSGWTSEGLSSLMLYRPQAPRQYGNLLCRATNAVGTQRSPCVFSVRPKPDPPPPPNLSCSVSNQTWDALEVTCSTDPLPEYYSVYNEDLDPSGAENNRKHGQLAATNSANASTHVSGSQRSNANVLTRWVETSDDDRRGMDGEVSYDSSDDYYYYESHSTDEMGRFVAGDDVPTIDTQQTKEPQKESSINGVVREEGLEAGDVENDSWPVDPEAKSPAHLIHANNKDVGTSDGERLGENVLGKGKENTTPSRHEEPNGGTADGRQDFYVMTVREKSSRAFIRNITSTHGLLTITGLTPGLDYMLEVSLQTPRRGASAPVLLTALTLRTAENRMRSNSLVPNTGLGAILGGGLGVLVAVICLLLAIKIRKKNSSDGSNSNRSPSTSSSIGTSGFGMSVVGTAKLGGFGVESGSTESKILCETNIEPITQLPNVKMNNQSAVDDRLPLGSGSREQRQATAISSFGIVETREDLTKAVVCPPINEILPDMNEFELINEVVNISDDGSPDLLRESEHSNSLSRGTYPKASYLSPEFLHYSTDGSACHDLLRGYDANSPVPTPPPPENFAGELISLHSNHTFVPSSNQKIELEHNESNNTFRESTNRLEEQIPSTEQHNVAEPIVTSVPQCYRHNQAADHKHLIQQHQQQQKALLQHHKDQQIVIPPHYFTYQKRSLSQRVIAPVSSIPKDSSNFRLLSNQLPKDSSSTSNMSKLKSRSTTQLSLKPRSSIVSFIDSSAQHDKVSEQSSPRRKSSSIVNLEGLHRSDGTSGTRLSGSDQVSHLGGSQGKPLYGDGVAGSFVPRSHFPANSAAESSEKNHRHYNSLERRINVCSSADVEQNASSSATTGNNDILKLTPVTLKTKIKKNE